LNTYKWNKHKLDTTINFISFSDKKFKEKYEITSSYPEIDILSNDEDSSSITEISPRKETRTRKRTRTGENVNGISKICRMYNFPVEKNRIGTWSPENKRIERAGAIVYIKHKDKIYFGVGIDNKSGDVTDFGGGVGRSDGYVKNGALRELREESLGVFGHIDPSELDKFLCVYTELILIIFIKLDVDPKNISDMFQQRVMKIQNPEVREIKWYTDKEFTKLIYGKSVDNKTMYDRIKPILREAHIKRKFYRYL